MVADLDHKSEESPPRTASEIPKSPQSLPDKTTQMHFFVIFSSEILDI